MFAECMCNCGQVLKVDRSGDGVSVMVEFDAAAVAAIAAGMAERGRMVRGVELSRADVRELLAFLK
jgi:hypothetical protein